MGLLASCLTVKPSKKSRQNPPNRSRECCALGLPVWEPASAGQTPGVVELPKSFGGMYQFLASLGVKAKVKTRGNMDEEWWGGQKQQSTMQLTVTSVKRLCRPQMWQGRPPAKSSVSATGQLCADPRAPWASAWRIPEVKGGAGDSWAHFYSVWKLIGLSLAHNQETRMLHTMYNLLRRCSTGEQEKILKHSAPKWTNPRSWNFGWTGAWFVWYLACQGRSDPQEESWDATLLVLSFHIVWSLPPKYATRTNDRNQNDAMTIAK